MAKDLHKKPFDEGTIAKLEIFEDYAGAWIPTFVMSGNSRISIYDFFAGQGYDVHGTAGSPIRILQKLNDHLAGIQSKKVEVDLYLNEFKKAKGELLREACKSFLSSNPELEKVVRIHFFNEDFEELFPKLSSGIGMVPSLVYLDQNGIKAISPTYFKALESKTRTDFLYFVSSSYFWRFGELPEFKAHLDVDIAEAKKDSYRFVHRFILDQIRKILPNETKLKLYPFSIKKGANIHGLIFGATHPLAVEKFLQIAWKRNSINGEANFDIDNDFSKSQPDLWGDKRLTKLELFERNVRERVLSYKIKNNSEMLEFAYSQGHLGSHASKILREMKKQGEITYDGESPLVTYENVFRLKKRLVYSVVKNDAK